MKYDLIIFDCDGTLVDSEKLSNSLIATMLREIGLSVSNEACLDLFKGKSFADIEAYIDQNLDHQLEFNFQESFRQRSKILFEAELKPIEGVETFLSSLQVKKCVASNGPQIKMKTTLEVTGLSKFFTKENIFSAYDINSWKPKPDLFLYACEMMKVLPEKTLVIEDTEVGGIAANKASIDVILFAHSERTKLEGLGFKCFSKFSELDKLLEI